MSHCPSLLLDQLVGEGPLKKVLRVVESTVRFLVVDTPISDVRSTTPVDP